MLSMKKIGRNVTEMRTNDAVVLFSYETPVAAIVNGERFRTSTRWSMTTQKHINRWIGGYPVEVMGQEFFWTLV